MSQSTRQRLLEAGKKLFAQKGYHKTTIEDITKEAGVSHGTFYVYFKSKKEFFLELLKQIRELILSTLNTGIKEKSSEKFFLDSFKELLKEKEIIKIFFFEAMCSDKDFINFYFESKRLFIEKIEEFLRLSGKKEYKLYAG
ncbi:TetR/AcrR family transcriptional regulator, partial [Aquifex sp.]